MVYLWFINTFVAIMFTMMFLNKTTKQLSNHYIPWILAFAFFAFSSFASWTAYLTGWTPWLYKAWYISGAVLVSLMGLGQLLFIKMRKTALLFSLYIALLFIAFVLTTATAPVDQQLLSSQAEVGGTALPSDVRLFSPLFTIPGSLALIGGALYSALWHKSRAGWLVGIGALILASGGALVRFDLPYILPLANLLGISIIFVGATLRNVWPRSLSLTNL